MCDSSIYPVVYLYNKYYVEGLTSKTGKLLNGKKGMVDHADPSAPGRYAVLMDGADTFVSIHQKNLVLRESVIAAPHCPTEYLPEAATGMVRPVDGLGMFAIRDIKAGERILHDPPFKPFNFDRENPAATMEFIKTLTPDELQVLRRLSDKGGPKVAETYPDADCRRMKLNALGFHGKGGKVHLMISRINHRCSRHPGYNAVAGADNVYATRDISRGEEIAMDYNDTHCIRRTEVLYTSWGIPEGSCSCVDCAYWRYIKRGLLTQEQVKLYGEICLYELHLAEAEVRRLNDGVELFKRYVERDANNRVVKDDSSNFYNGFGPFEAMMREQIREREELLGAVDNAGYICDDGTIVKVPPALKSLEILYYFYLKLYAHAVKLPLYLENIAWQSGQKNVIFCSLPKKKINKLYQDLYNAASRLEFGNKERMHLKEIIALKEMLTQQMQQFGSHYHV